MLLEIFKLPLDLWACRTLKLKKKKKKKSGEKKFNTPSPPSNVFRLSQI